MTKNMCSHENILIASMRAEEVAKVLAAQDSRLQPEYILSFANISANTILRDKVCVKCKHCMTELTDFKEKIKNMTNEEVETVTEKVRTEFIASANHAAKARLKNVEANRIFDTYIKERNDGRLQEENK